MKKIFTLAFIAITLASCVEKYEKTEKEHFDFGEPGPFIELDYTDGEYTPKTPPITQADFDNFFQGSWKVKQIGSISKTGKVTSETMLSGVDYPFFTIKENGRILQYTDKSYNYKAGSYSYDASTGILNFTDVVNEHPQFRIISLEETEMTGTFRSSDNNSDSSVLTLYSYTRLSPADEPPYIELDR